MDSDEAAAYVGVSPRTLERWRAAGAGPPYYRLGPRTVYYRAADLRRWLASRRISPNESGCREDGGASGH
ncbi:MAG: helix-turn-helix transcriptional regulator [Myxococcota bacterium]